MSRALRSNSLKEEKKKELTDEEEKKELRKKMLTVQKKVIQRKRKGKTTIVDPNQRKLNFSARVLRSFSRMASLLSFSGGIGPQRESNPSSGDIFQLMVNHFLMNSTDVEELLQYTSFNLFDTIVWNDRLDPKQNHADSYLTNTLIGYDALVQNSRKIRDSSETYIAHFTKEIYSFARAFTHNQGRSNFKLSDYFKISFRKWNVFAENAIQMNKDQLAEFKLRDRTGTRISSWTTSSKPDDQTRISFLGQLKSHLVNNLEDFAFDQRNYQNNVAGKELFPFTAQKFRDYLEDRHKAARINMHHKNGGEVSGFVYTYSKEYQIPLTALCTFYPQSGKIKEFTNMQAKKTKYTSFDDYFFLNEDQSNWEFPLMKQFMRNFHKILHGTFDLEKFDLEKKEEEKKEEEEVKKGKKAAFKKTWKKYHNEVLWIQLVELLIYQEGARYLGSFVHVMMWVALQEYYLSRNVKNTDEVQEEDIEEELELQEIIQSKKKENEGNEGKKTEKRFIAFTRHQIKICNY